MGKILHTPKTVVFSNTLEERQIVRLDADLAWKTALRDSAMKSTPIARLSSKMAKMPAIKLKAEMPAIKLKAEKPATKLKAKEPVLK